MIKILGQPTDEMLLAANACFALLNLEGDCFIELNFADSSEIKELNLRTRNIDRETDVLSFPMLDKITAFSKENYPYDFDNILGGVMLGSIVICESVAEMQAIEYGHSKTREFTYLFVHGMLHLLGFDHMTEEDKPLMREKEELILNEIGVNR